VRFVKRAGDHDVERERCFDSAHDRGESKQGAAGDPGRDVAAYADGERCVGHHEEPGGNVASKGGRVGQRSGEQVQKERMNGCFDGERNVLRSYLSGAVERMDIASHNRSGAFLSRCRLLPSRSEKSRTRLCWKRSIP